MAGGPPATGTGLAAAVAERRRVSVLFADLVGFTGLAEDRDPEAVRELLTRYFDLAREVIERYGGTVEKFIGDAVMAVWGAPIAREDDAERAVRAALDLVDVVRSLGLGADGEPVRARAGVLTGEAAVTLGATNQGMVAGDLVNTASRLQSVAAPGTVLVGEATYQATTDAIAYEPAGDQLVKGRTAPVPAWRARRVVAKIGGVGRSEGLEPPFVGRDDQLRMLKDFLHSTGREKRLRFVSVTGEAGTGKSRLTWEFLKYVDGLVEDVFWHQGRSPAYGEGITFWALGEMVRKRAGLAESDDADTTRAKIAAALEQHVPDEQERRWIEPKLLGLLGLEELRTLEREELFGAWRTFFERVSDQATTVLVFEDIHWADQGLLDFIDHLAEWSVAHPILVVTLARPVFLEQHRDWGAGRRNFVALSLEPLPDTSMEALLSGIVPGLPAEATEAILNRAEGIPLYAVETVRKLLVDGRIERIGDAYRPVGDLSRLEVPETLHALIAARLDTLTPAERSLLQDASILGQTFTVGALAMIAGDAPADMEPRLRDLVRRDVLVQNRDPRSPERGQYGFVQALIREVAYGTLARRDRRARHLAAARYFESLGDDELAGVLATHYLDAYRASDAGPEGDTIAVQARIALRAAAERAISLHSPRQALAFLEPALEVTADAAERAGLLELRGRASRADGDIDAAGTSYRAAIDAFGGVGDRAAAARATAELGMMFAGQGRAAEGIAVMQPFLDASADLGSTLEVMQLTATLARGYLFADDYDRALELIDRVLVQAERIDDVALITDAILTKGSTLMYAGRFREGLALMAGGLQFAEGYGLTGSELRARLNISFLQTTDDPRQAYATARVGFDRARRLGIPEWTLLLGGNVSAAGFVIGEWDTVVAIDDEVGTSMSHPGSDAAEVIGVAVAVRAFRGEGPEADARLERFDASLATATASQEQGIRTQIHALVELARGRFADVLRHDLSSIEPLYRFHCQLVAGHAAVWSGDLAAIERILAGMDDSGVNGRWALGIRRGLEAGRVALSGRADAAAAIYREALDALRELGALRDVALLLMDRVATGRDEASRRAAADEAAAIWTRLDARGALDRLAELVSGGTRPVPAPTVQARPAEAPVEA
jgi:class 3 adenylate cyclase/tetratricopeptide (TPR) repeat protein